MHCRRIVTKPLLAAIVASSLLLIQDRSSTARSEETSDRSGVILYVDDSAPPQGNGLSWQTAIRYLQDALAVANAPDSGVSEIRIGQGTYKADQGANQTPGNVMASFRVANFAVRGGYAGLGAPDPDARDFEKFQTILSGDLLGNDGPAQWQNYTDNSRQIMRVNFPTGSTMLEGLVVRGSQGQQDVFGGGLRCEAGTLHISFCTFEDNRAHAGGGAYIRNGDTTIEQSRFLRNLISGGTTGYGGALLLIAGTASVIDTEFVLNGAWPDYGGAVSCEPGHRFERCSFRQNSAETEGGAAFGYGEFYECEFIDNRAAWAGGGIYGNVLVVDCLFRDNNAYLTGGAIHAKATVINSRFLNNDVDLDGGGAFWGSGTIINCEFTSNRSNHNYWGGAVVVCPPTGGLQICGPATFINCLFNGNSTFSRGGGVDVDQQTATLINCTWANNVGVQGHGALHVRPNSNAIVRNGIMWNNAPNALGGAGALDVQFSSVQGGWPGQGNIAADPMFIDPMGPDGTPGSEDDDLRLSAGSPCIDAGNNLVLPPDTFDLDNDGNTSEPLPIDMDGFLRRVNDPNTPNTGNPPNAQVIVDMGAYEFRDFKPLLGDVTSDGVVNVNDLLAVINSWGPCSGLLDLCPADLNADGVVNHLDLVIVINHWG